jgi:hypothetical protein
MMVMETITTTAMTVMTEMKMMQKMTTLMASGKDERAIQVSNLSGDNTNQKKVSNNI